MQLKMNNEQARTKLPKKTKLKTILEAENVFITQLLQGCNVPDRIEGDDSEMFLLPIENSTIKAPTIDDYKKSKNIELKTDFDDRLMKIKNKLKAPRSKNKTEKQLKRKEMKKLKKNKEVKKILISSNKAEKNEKIKGSKSATDTPNDAPEDDKKDFKTNEKSPYSQQDTKMLFSRIDFAEYPGAKVKKTKREKVMKNPKDILKKMKQTDKKINELKEQGEEEKAREIQKQIIWKKAFDKVRGKKVKDDRNLLYKSIKKKKDLKKKSKKTWKDREEKVKQDIASRQKKREENINKRKKDNKVKKLKRLSKRGRVVPGF